MVSFPRGPVAPSDDGTLAPLSTGARDAVHDGRSPPFDGKNKKGRTRGSRSCLWVVEEGLLGWVLRREDRFDDVDGLPIAAEGLRDAGRELDSDSQAALLVEAVRILSL